MLSAILALAATSAQLPEEDLQVVLANWEVGQMYCAQGYAKACAQQKAYAAKMRARFGLCPAKSGERGAVVMCKTGKAVEINFD